MSGKRLLFERILGLDDSWNHSAYASVDRWVKGVRRGGDARATKHSYLKWLSCFLRFVNLNPKEDSELGDRSGSFERRELLVVKVRGGLTPDGLVELPSGSLSEKVQAFCDRYNEAGKARTAHSALVCLRSFFKHNGVGELSLEDYNWRRSRRMEHVPTKEEVYRMADGCDERGRAILLCAFQSGLRNAAVRALRYGDVKGDLQSGAIPVRVHVNLRFRERVPQACKEDAEYFTFFGKEAAEALKEYVDWRCQKQGRVGDDEPLFLPYEAFGQKTRPDSHLSEDSLQRMIKRAGRRARIKEWQCIRFHSLRKTFRAVLDAGYVDGGQMAEDDKEYLMGHRLPGSKEPYHNANVEVLAQRYMRLNWAFFPKQEASVEELRKKQVLDTVRILGFSDDKIKRVEEALARYERVDEALDEIRKLESGSYKLANENRRQRDAREEKHACGNAKVVRGEQGLVRSLNEGWELVKELSNDKFLLKRSFD